MSLLLLVHVTAGASCPGDVAATSVADLDDRLRVAEDAFEGPLAGVAVRAGPAHLALGCLSEVVPVPLAARYHRLRALLASDGASALVAALALDPELTLPEVFQVGVDLQVGHVRVPRPLEGSLYFDGVESRRRPVGVPTVVQLSGAEGRVVETAWVRGDEPLPAYVTVHGRNARRLGLAAGATGAVAVGAYLGALAVKQTALQGGARSPDQNASIRGAGVGLTVLSAASGMTAVGLGLAGAVTLRGGR